MGQHSQQTSSDERTVDNKRKRTPVMITLTGLLEGSSKQKPITANETDTIFQLKALVCQAFGVNPDHYVLWDYTGNEETEPFVQSDMDKTLQERYLLEDQFIKLKPVVQQSSLPVQSLMVSCEGYDSERAIQVADTSTYAEVRQAICDEFGVEDSPDMFSLWDCYVPGEQGEQQVPEVEMDLPISSMLMSNQKFKLTRVRDADVSDPLQVDVPECTSPTPAQGFTGQPVFSPNSGPLSPVSDPLSPISGPLSPESARPSTWGSPVARAAKGTATTPKDVTLLAVCEGKEGMHEVTLLDSATLGQLKKQACGAFDVPPSQYSLWDFFQETDGDEFHVGEMGLTVKAKKLVDRQHVKIKLKTDMGGSDDEAGGEDMAAANISQLFASDPADPPDHDVNPFEAGEEGYGNGIEVSTPGHSEGVAGCHFTPRLTAGITTRSGAQYGTRSTSVGGYTSGYKSGLYRSSFNGPEDTAQAAMNRLPGLAGLSNLGNTCFMNSSLQCLAHAVPLLRAFLSGAYLDDINRVNPLGMKGELAEAFGGLMELLWQGNVSHVTPRKFKERIGRFAPQFSGYAQHDSQEFLAFLLDGLHEDLNRIKNKPYIEEKDSAGRSDTDLAAEAWANYRARNDSSIVDHFQGLYKSRLDCPRCHYTSVKFDPFMYLSLPLPESRMRHLVLHTVVLAGDHMPMRCVVEVPNAGTVRDVQSALWRLMAATPAPGNEEDGTTQLQPASPAPPGALLPAPPMLCAKVSRGFNCQQDEVELFTPSCRVSEIVPSSKTIAGEFLVMYIYPRPAAATDADAGEATDAPGAAPAAATPNGHAGANFKGHENDTAMQGSGTSQQQEQQDGVAAVTNGLLPLEKQEQELQEGGMDTVMEDEADGGDMQAEEMAAVQANGEHAASAALLDPFAGLPYQEGLCPVIVHHRAAGQTYTRGQFFMAPLVLWLPPEVLPTTVDHPDVETIPPAARNYMAKKEYVVRGAPGDLIARAVHIALKPFRTPAGIAADEALAAAATNAAQPVAAAAEQPEQDGEARAAAAPDSNSQPPRKETAAETDAQTDAEMLPALVEDGPDAGESRADLPVASTAAGPGLVGGDVGSAVVDGEPGSGAAGGEWSSQGSPFAGHSVQPFNMWAVQEQQQRDAALQAGVTGEGYRLLVSDDKGNSHFYSRTSAFDTVEQDKTWHLVCEWSADGGNRWDMSALKGPPPDHGSMRAHLAKQRAGKAPVSLQACVEAFLQPEELAAEDSWYCPRCKDHVQADKKLDLWALPEVLVVHLKRFSYTRYSRDKLDTPVEFPDLLDLSPYISTGGTMAPPTRPPASQQQQQQQQQRQQQEPADAAIGAATAPVATPQGAHPDGLAAGAGSSTAQADMSVDEPPLVAAPPVQAATSAAHQPASTVTADGPLGQSASAAAVAVGGAPGAKGVGQECHQYQLFAVVNHFGSLGGGHYTAHAKMPGTHRWHTYDDSSVSSTDAEDVVSPAAYLLFYRSTQAAAADPHGLLQTLLAQQQARTAKAAAADQGDNDAHLTTDQGAAEAGQHPSLPVSELTRPPSQSPEPTADTQLHGGFMPQQTYYACDLPMGVQGPSNYTYSHSFAEDGGAGVVPQAGLRVAPGSLQQRASGGGGSFGGGFGSGFCPGAGRTSSSGGAGYVPLSAGNADGEGPGGLHEQAGLLALAAHALQQTACAEAAARGNGGGSELEGEDGAGAGYGQPGRSDVFQDQDEIGEGGGVGRGFSESGGMGAPRGSWTDLDSFHVRGACGSGAGAGEAGPAFWVHSDQSSGNDSLDGHRSEMDPQDLLDDEDGFHDGARHDEVGGALLDDEQEEWQGQGQVLARDGTQQEAGHTEPEAEPGNSTGSGTKAASKHQAALQQGRAALRLGKEEGTTDGLENPFVAAFESVGMEASQGGSPGAVGNAGVSGAQAAATAAVAGLGAGGSGLPARWLLSQGSRDTGEAQGTRSPQLVVSPIKQLPGAAGRNAISTTAVPAVSNGSGPISTGHVMGVSNSQGPVVAGGRMLDGLEEAVVVVGRGDNRIAGMNSGCCARSDASLNGARAHGEEGVSGLEGGACSGGATSDVRVALDRLVVRSEESGGGVSL